MGNSTASQTPHFNATNTLPDDIPERSTWMAGIPDNFPITLLSIPGTHSSCSALVNKHQSLDISHALKAGIRYFDVQLRLEENSKLMLWHDNKSLEKRFETLLESLVFFLLVNKSEAIICRITEGYSSEGNGKFSDVICREIERFVPSNCFWATNELPQSIGEARQKIVFLRDFPDGTERLVPFINSVCSNRIGMTRNREGFWKSVHEDLIQARKSKEFSIHITYLSHKDFSYDDAEDVNKRLLQYLDEADRKCRLGIIAMDFPGSKLINMIIEKNVFVNITQLADRNCLMSSECPIVDPREPEENEMPKAQQKSLLEI